MRILIVIGSRADEGILRIVGKALEESGEDVTYLGLQGRDVPKAYRDAEMVYEAEKPELVLLLGDRFEILAAATAAHLARIPIAHIGGGDVSEGSYDDAMRDCITRMSSIHFTTSTQSEVRVQYLMGQKNVHMVGSPGVDFIMHGDWKKERPIEEPYVVVAYYPETIDGTNEIKELMLNLPEEKHQCFIMPNPDRGSDELRSAIENAQLGKMTSWHDALPHAEFLNLLYHSDEFIGNSSALYYEAPFLGVKTLEIGKRQKGRVIPFGDGHACERIVKIMKESRCF